MTDLNDFDIGYGMQNGNLFIKNSIQKKVLESVTRKGRKGDYPLAYSRTFFFVEETL